MAVKTGPIDSGAVLDRLNALRLEKDWSFRQLSAVMARAEVLVSAQTLHQLLTDRESKPYDRTIHKIRRYLDTLPVEGKPAARKQKRRAA